MPSYAAAIEDVSRLFGRFAALRHISLSIESGCCYVLLGENGAGKSTLLRIIAGLLEPSSGRVRLFPGRPALEANGAEADGSGDWQSSAGYMSHAPMLYDELSARENLDYFAGLYQERPCLSPAEALRSVGLDPGLSRPVGSYSQGMRQRASLARVLLPQPDLLLLDEPFSNMDAASARQMLDMLSRLRGEGRTIVLTTHQRELAAPLADWFVTLEAGSLVSILPGPRSGPLTGPANPRPPGEGASSFSQQTGSSPG